MRRTLILASLCLVACVAPDRPAARSTTHAAASTEALTASCVRVSHAELPHPLPSARQGSAIAIANTGKNSLVYVADADSRSIHTLAIDEPLKELGRTRLASAPRSLLVLADGRVVVTLVNAGRVAVLEPSADPSQPMTTLCERDVPDEPSGIARTVDGAKIAITSQWGAALTVLNGETFATERTIALSRDPRDVLIEPNDVAFVSHVVGTKVSVVDLANAAMPVKTVSLAVRKSTPLASVEDAFAMRSATQGFSLASMPLRSSDKAKRMTDRILVPMVSVDPGDRVRQSKTYYGPPFDGVPKQAPIVNVIDADRKESMTSTLLGTTTAAYARECLLPRASAVRAETSSLFVACAGIDAVLELDALAADPFRAEKHRYSVSPSPQGIAIDEAHARVIVFSQLGATVTVVPLDHSASRSIAVDYHPDASLVAVARGRQLFERTDDTRISDDGLACASCHIDGRDDGLTWITPTGPRQTPMLAGRLTDTSPYGWEGDRPTVVSYVGNTVVNLGGKGLDPPDVLALAEYLESTTGPSRHETGEDASLVSRGRSLFEDPEQGCQGCHHGASTDQALHKFNYVPNDPLQQTDTPALRFVRGTAPYFHDGRYATLDALLADGASTMGHSATLAPEDRAALAAYVQSL